MHQKNFEKSTASVTTGERRVLENILSVIASGSAAHSYILEGGSGASRLRCAQHIACALVCTDKKDKMPCLCCSQCKKILDNEHTDIKTISPEKGSGKSKSDIKVDVIRTLRKEAYVLPTDCDYHIYIISESEKMNSGAQNALLKVLEEPPENTVFLLLTPSKELLLPTVVSRAQSHTLGKSSAEETEAIFREKYRGISDATLKRAARMQCVLDKIEFDLTAIKVIENAYKTAQEYYIEKKHRITESLPTDKEELVLTLSALAVSARDIAVAKREENADIFFFDRDEDLEKAKESVSLRRAMELYEAFAKAAERTQSSGNTSSILAELFVAIRK